MNLTLVISLIFGIILLEAPLDKALLSSSPSHVEIRRVDNQSSFFINGEKIEIKGVGLNYEDGHDFELLKKIGGNSFRTWSAKYAEIELEAAKSHDLMVAMGINLGKELHGFDYNDDKAVEAQLERVKKIVVKYKNHPNLLCWVVGNELNLLFDKDGGLKMVNSKTYIALQQIVDFIHDEDPNHPVTTTFAGINSDHIDMALKYCHNLDFISVQVYGALEILEEEMNQLALNKPYLVTEFGPVGFWEMPKTSWGREIEEASGPKASGILARMKKSISRNKSGDCLGGYVFEWGQKQERTPTWFGMFYADGSQTETIDLLEKEWTGSYPENRAPHVTSITLNGFKATDDVIVKPDQKMHALVQVNDPDGDPIKYQWMIYEEVGQKSLGGAFEQEPKSSLLTGEEFNKNTIEMFSPKKKGEYRLLVYTYDLKGKAGSANIPFLVK